MICDLHKRDLSASGLTDETIADAQLRCGNAAEVKRILGFDAGSGLIIEYPRTNGTQAAYIRIKPDSPFIGRDRKPAKYLSSKGAGNRLFIPHEVDPVLQDSRTALWITEGEKKCLKACQEGLACIAVPGVWNWRQRANSRSMPIPDLDLIVWNGRTVFLVFDSDLRTNKQVGAALYAFAKELKRRGANVSKIDLPDGPGGSKVGLDDYLLKHTVESLCAIEPSPIVSSDMPFVSMKDFLNEPEDKTSWLVEGLLPMGGDSLIVAKPKVGKSTLAECLALAVARGNDFLGRKTTQGTVLYLAFEGKRAEVRQHFRLMGVKEEDPILLFCAKSPADGFRLLEEAISVHKPVLVIIDPLFRFVRVKDCNDYASMTNALEPLHALARESGAHVMSSHHAGKGDREAGDSCLGSTAIFASVDTLLEMKRHQNYRTLSSVQRYGTDLAEITLQWDEQTQTMTAGMPRAEADISKAMTAIIDFLKTQSEPVEWSVIDDAVEGRTQINWKALKEAQKSGKTNRIGKGKKGDPYLYSVSLSGISAYMAGNRERETVTSRNEKSISLSGLSAQDWEREIPGKGKPDTHE
jgi:AAA domain/Domain of unknown function (DUF3854)